MLAAHGTIAGGGPSNPGSPTTSSNSVFDPFGTVGGGAGNRAGTDNASATEPFAVVAGGANNRAGGGYSSVGGGGTNSATGLFAAISGGDSNNVTSTAGFIGGGRRNTVTNGVGSGAVVGGEDNHNDSDLGFIGGGRENSASGAENAIVGGRGNIVGGFDSFVGAGYLNSATGSYSVVPGGLLNQASGDYTFAAGRRAKAVHTGAMVLADSADADFSSGVANSLSIRASGGVAINRSSQLGAASLTVRGTFTNGFNGMYVEGLGSTALPFYGYAIDGAIKSYSYFSDGASANARTWNLVVASATPLIARGDGSVAVTGSLSKAGGSFKIDHPLDPENQYLYHSFVESPDMMNIYNGLITTDGAGYATVTLPEWFDALNREFRYQLTVIDDGEAAGDFVLTRVVRKIEGNRFVIKTSVPNVEVSWQVTGVRKDAWAEQNRIPTAVEKEPENRGRYLHPAAFHQPADRGINFRPMPESTPGAQ